MHSLEEKRVYGDRSGAIDAYVASSVGVVRVQIAGGTVGEFGLCDRRHAHDIAATRTGSDGAVAIATDDDVCIHAPRSSPETGAADDESFVETGFGAAVAVGYDGETLLAAGPDGRVGRHAGDGWETLESDAIETVTAIDGDLVGTDRGVYRVHGDSLDHAGLTAVRDVSAAGIPLAATADGLYKLGNGWMDCLEGSFDVVAAEPHTDRGTVDPAHAATGGTIYAHDPANGEWDVVDEWSESVAGIEYGERMYAVSEQGTFRAATDRDEPGMWRSQPIGLTDVTGIAIAPSSASSDPTSS